MKSRRYYRRILRRAFLFMLACALVVFLTPIGTKVKSMEYLLGKNWAECKIPTAQSSSPFRPSDFRPENCARGFSRVIRRQGSYLQKVYDVRFATNKIRCFYAPLFRVHPNETQPPYAERFRLGVPSEFYKRKEMVDEFVYVNCTYLGVTIFEDYFSFFPKKRHATLDTTRGDLNVLLVGLEGVSRANLYRTMPKTVRYLKRKLDAIDFLKYHKVGGGGGGAFENIAPLLVGLNAREFKRAYHKKNARKVLSSLLTYKYMNAGFMTAFGEDCSAHGVFKDDYVFKTRPAHYYWGPCNVALDVLGGNAKKGNCSVCFKDKMFYEALLDYAGSFARAMRENKRVYLGVFWANSLTTTEDPSEGLYLPRLADEGYKKFFVQLHDDGLLMNTVVVFVSESGYVSPRLGGSQQYAQEENLPFLFVVLPKNFKLMYPKLVSNINENSKRHLVTPFDVHKTLLDLLDLKQLGAKAEVQSYKMREYNLFRELPPARSCKWAGIDPKFCSCATSFASAILDLF